MKIKIIKTIAYLSVLAWTSIGITTIASIINSSVGLFINIIMGVIFIAIAYYIYKKIQNTLEILNDNNSKNKIYKNLFKINLIFFILSLLTGIILMWGTIYRTFIEKNAIFG